MTNLSETILAKSDQLNAIDLIAGPMTITVTEVIVKKGEDQPTTIKYEGCNGHPFKPSKGMRRVLCAAWGDESDTYPGRSMTLFNEPTVTWAGKQVGGIHISHVTDIDKSITIPLILTRGKSIPYTVKPLVLSDKTATKSETPDPIDVLDAVMRATPHAANGSAAFGLWWNSDEGKKYRGLIKGDEKEFSKLQEMVKEADADGVNDEAPT